MKLLARAPFSVHPVEYLQNQGLCLTLLEFGLGEEGGEENSNSKNKRGKETRRRTDTQGRVACCLVQLIQGSRFTVCA